MQTISHHTPYSLVKTAIRGSYILEDELEESKATLQQRHEKSGWLSKFYCLLVCQCIDMQISEEQAARKRLYRELESLK